MNFHRLFPVAVILCAGALCSAQPLVPVGSGGYADGIPPSDQYLGGYYSMTAQQVVNYYTNLHVAASVTNQPLPSNKWWTDTMVADRSYQPASGGPRVIQQDPFGGQLWVFPAMVAPNAAGFDLYYPNSWSPRSNPNIPEGGFNSGPALPITGAVPLAVGSNDILIADFDETNYPGGWVTTGTAFGTGPIPGGSWPGESPPVQGFLGSACVNTYRGGNSPQGTLTSPSFTIQKHYIDLLVGGGEDTNNAAVWLVIGTNILCRATGQQSGTLYWNTWDVSAYLGQTAHIEIVDTTSGGWGFVLCSWIVATDDAGNPATRYSGSFAPVSSQVTGWSDWGMQFGLPDAQGRRLDLTLARGVPFVWTVCTGVNPVINCGGGPYYDTNGNAFTPASGGSFSNSVFAFNYQGRSFGVFAPSNTSFAVAGSAVTAQFGGASQFLVFGLLPSTTNLSEFAQYAYARVTGTQMAWTYDQTNGQVDTSWSVTTVPLQGTQTNTLQGWLPHHYRTTSNTVAFRPYTFLTPRGVMRMAAGTQFQFNYNFHGIAPMLPAPHLNNTTNDYVAGRMTNYVLNFAANHPQDIADTYYGGKDMAITAQYINFARQLGMTNTLAQMLANVRGELTNWYSYAPGKTNFMFSRYDNWGALIGFPADFGSEAFNDNHFHYGYFALATALIGTEDTNFLTQYGPMARLVAKEYANWDRTDTNFPFLRTFDIWEGHSWAGGFSSGTGNNQESSSEAMNSWVGLFLLGAMLGDNAMTAAGAMGYVNESAAVNEYWQDMYRTNFPASYGEGMNGILWANGLTYATYFDGDPAWIYGIQFVPANHWNNYLARNPSFANWQLTNLWTERVLASEYGINGFTLTDANNATALGGYLGNYILGFQLLFDPDDVAAQMDAGWSTNAAIATDPTYSGVTYYLTHTLRGLGNPDPDYYTSLPTSQVYFNANTGTRTAILFNPSASVQSVTLYRDGVAVGSVSVPPRVLTPMYPGQTNSLTLSLEVGAQVSWPTRSGDQYQLQYSTGPTNPGAWNNLGGIITGSGATNFVFDPAYPALHKNFRVLDYTSGTGQSIVLNGGFESGAGTSATGWTQGGSQPPQRVNTAAHSGSYSMEIYVTNSASSPNTSSMDQNLASAGGGAVTPGSSYSFSFWTMSVASGPSYVQNYGITWLNSGGQSVGFTGWIGFGSGNGAWTQITATNLVAPAGAVNADLEIYGVTGAVQNGYGGSLIDDILFSPASPPTTNTVASTVVAGAQLTWPTMAGYTYELQKALSLSTRTASWSNLTSILGQGGTQAWFDPSGTNAQSWYRLAQMP